MKKFLCVVFVFVFVCLSGCSGGNAVKVENNQFVMTPQQLIDALDARIKEQGLYPQFPEFKQHDNGDLIDYATVFSDGAGYRIATDKETGNIIEIDFWSDLSSISEYAMEALGYYMGVTSRILNPNSKTDFSALEPSRITENDIRSMPDGNAFYVMIVENGMVQTRIYPLGK